MHPCAPGGTLRQLRCTPADCDVLLSHHAPQTLQESNNVVASRFWTLVEQLLWSSDAVQIWKDCTNFFGKTVEHTGKYIHNPFLELVCTLSMEEY
jgi:hypothetical protein